MRVCNHDNARGYRPDVLVQVTEEPEKIVKDDKSTLVVNTQQKLFHPS